MSFLHPAALAGFASLLVLLLLSLWRHRPARVVVASLRLWTQIPDRVPPVRSFQRPRPSLSLILQMMAASAIVLAMAGPGLSRLKPAPRKIAVVFDVSAPMAPRMEEAIRELSRLDPSDVTVLIETPTLRRREAGFVKPVDFVRTGPPGPALDLAAAEAPDIVFISDRRPSWTPPPRVRLHLALVGGPLENNGFVDGGVDGDTAFLRLRRAAPVEIRIDGRREVLPAQAFHLVPIPSGARRLEASIEADAFPADDRVALEREAATIDVGLIGRPDVHLRAALEAESRARLVVGGRPRLLIRVGVDDGPEAPVTVDVDPPEGVTSWASPGEITVSRHPLLDGVRPADLKLTQVGRIEGPVETPLLFSDREPIAALVVPGRIVMAVRTAASGWPSTSSFPIFWSNVVNYAASGTASWRASGLLDAEASAPGSDRSPLDPAVFGPRPLTPVRTDLTEGFLALAVALLACLWFVERR